MVAKGITGIRKLLAEDRAGWHLIVDDVMGDYVAERLSEILAAHPSWTLTGATGNGLTFTTTPAN